MARINSDDSDVCLLGCGTLPAPRVGFFLIDQFGFFLFDQFGFFLIDQSGFFLFDQSGFFLIDQSGFFLIDQSGFFLIDQSGFFLFDQSGQPASGAAPRDRQWLLAAGGGAASTRPTPHGPPQCSPWALGL